MVSSLPSDALSSPPKSGILEYVRVKVSSIGMIARASMTSIRRSKSI